ncbi:Bcebp4 [Penicillium atrosanguineum]|uniref:Bcebp4 n=1 Tax=Penicillium atrosanguineum TaxID=1132637 RepID=A0A9W9LD52_9EURO|nr:CAZyme family AA7 [Penicillium atrosanguineum]KAJ5134004.1 Bcebp4 [Penicillium atrosanguineum]KAJ5149397.1 Bcebp4 [Penicillium atrosanguineum]KAJ5304712.1 CAZyme family AA7 [Penicillium atrosanguineum]KAJ5324177.1 Bcebp4 [Penicillium atrosanguineum]
MAAHPYYPIDLEIVGYLANEWDTVTLVSLFASGCTAIFLATYLLVMKIHPKISNGDLWTIMWFVLCGCIHLFFEGYFAYNFRRMPSMQDLFGQLWKEYSLSDSRYQTQDAFVLCMETITAAFWGPLSFVLAGMIMTSHPLRYPLQAIISLGQLYGDILYYATCLFDNYILGLEYSRPEAAIFWGYFVFCNAFWIVIPLYLIYTSLCASKKAFTALAVSQGNGSMKAVNGKASKSE